MAGIRASITIDLPEGADFKQYMHQIRQQLSKITGTETYINISDIDDPISLNPRVAKKVNQE